MLRVRDRKEDLCAFRDRMTEDGRVARCVAGDGSRRAGYTQDLVRDSREVRETR
jgi:hypothetical protein